MLDNRYSKSIHYRPVQSRTRQRLVSWLTVFPLESGGTKKRYIPHLEIYKYIVPALGCMNIDGLVAVLPVTRVLVADVFVSSICVLALWTQ